MPGRFASGPRKKDGQSYAASSASWADGRLTLRFGSSGVIAVLKVAAHKHWFVGIFLTASGGLADAGGEGGGGKAAA